NDAKENGIKSVEKTKENAKTPPTTHQKPKPHVQTNAHTNQKKDEK
ncbi:preprotein translocase subunit SecG, partial [Helicobacter pylori]